MVRRVVAGGATPVERPLSRMVLVRDPKPRGPSALVVHFVLDGDRVVFRSD